MGKKLAFKGMIKMFSGILVMGLIPMVLLPYVLVKRIVNEEKVLKEELKGYEEYCDKIRYRLIPFVW